MMRKHASDGFVEMIVAPEISSVSDSTVNFTTGTLEASNVTLAVDSRGSLFATWASWGHTPAGDPTNIRIQFSRWPAGANLIR
jgi:hypothetical protein